MRKITYKVTRFDGEKNWVQAYSFPYQAGKTILWGLIQIKETLDPSLNFTASCRHAICGACAVRVNGQAALACETPLDKMLNRWQSDTLTLEPLQNFDVIRDLVVDWGPKAERLAEVQPWLMPKDEFSVEKGCLQRPEDFKKINKSTDCILCGCCASECNKLSGDNGDFLEPFVFAKAQKFVADSRDKNPEARIQAAINHGAWKCQHCQECITKCPKGLEPAEDISKLRQAAIARGLINHKGVRHAKAFLDDIQKTGRLNEGIMAVKTEGLIKTIGNVPVAIRLMRKGKLSPLQMFPKPIHEVNDVRTLLKTVKELEKLRSEQNKTNAFPLSKEAAK